MKKSWLALIAAPVIAYPAAAWYLGARVESTLDAQYKQAETLPYAKIVERTYERGVFSASESVTIELFGDMMRALQASADAPDTPAQPLRIRFQSQIQHGPFAGGALAAAVVDSELVFDADTQAEVAKLFGDNKPLTGHTVFKLDGSGTSKVLSPAVNAQIPNPETGEPVDVAWQGISAEVDFAPNMTRYTMRGEAPKLEVKDATGTHMVMTGMRFTGEQQRIFDDEPLLLAGSQRFSIDDIQMRVAGDEAAPIALKQITYDVDMPAEGDFVDMVAKMGAQVVDIGGTNYGPAHYDLSFKHLHARTVAKLYRTLLQAYSNPRMVGPDADPQLALAPLAEPAMELLGHNPSFSLDRLSFTTPHGDAHLDLRASVPGITPEAMANPGLIMAVLDAGGNIALPEAMLLGMVKDRAHAQMSAMSETGTVSDDDLQMVVAQLEDKLQQLSGQGYITRDGGVVKSTVAFKAGQLTVNGQPFNPMAMQ
ncbi:YdgA family protein [Denitromonas iodatirespirans]|uniref:YdgA family protein n=1 Tax=Denitromonas iodatirespirans TaxID=2795389 RepID=A0A944D8Q5_DENI1|nr:YdgA family protein [Denitromonas iodatirespirans]MBT0960088.1 YdgA family protein [Denitromonas iodatirespirans]